MTIGFKANNDGSVAIQVNGTDRISMTSAGAMSVPAGVTADLTGNSSTATQLSTASGAAPSYSARAWVNFNGTGTVAIRASGNVSSITDGGVGAYTVNFATAMSDANFAAVATQDSAVNHGIVVASFRTTAGVTLSTVSNGAVTDMATVSVVIFR